ncbi:PHB depolymerase family esterase [Nocardia sp. CDC153]|uniref:extracellular catalytic domain type 2 short-chain-length polyhydroxyalkanoate depolymerase n=1 Tax=Nocardia sp. CDC153 TaxID=3112167 RepID=UPI002DBBC36E|nr:PHB depolymerase family esterase [Nocardia sp. CDC153]MEC3958213.1 PHB depolymerase family esterase [Nocardia sp. CDC153]
MKFGNALSALAIAAGLAAATATVVTAAVPSPTPDTLRGYNISGTYVSGVSSGGYMANQLHVAYSGVFAGAGIFTAGPYRCAGDFDNAVRAQNSCMQNVAYPGRATPAQLESQTKDLASQGKVDPVSNLSGAPVYLYHGTSDNTVVQAVNDDLATYYSDFGANVTYNKASAAGHSWVSPLGPVNCSDTTSPFINNCDNDPEKEMLAKFFGSVSAPASTLNGKLIQFDQNAYAPGGSASAISMDDKGFAYVPQSCAGGTSCRLLVALHGCKQGYDYQSFGDTFMKDAYLNEYADTNNMIVLYPQAIPLSNGNPNGCWNWWGFSGDANYAWHGGKQIEAIMAMVRKISGGATPPTSTTTVPPTTTTTVPPTTTTTVPPTTTTTTPAPTCVTASNYAHVQAGRAHQSMGTAYANGSNQNLGLWNTFVTSTIKETSPGYWEKC